jgi:hypothetical protein
MARQFFVNLTNIKFCENPFSRSEVVTCVQTDGQSDLIGVTQGRNRAYKVQTGLTKSHLAVGYQYFIITLM